MVTGKTVGGLSCQQPANTTDDGDCDDEDEDVNPGADEYCDEIDNDCDDEIDESDALDAYIWFSDADGDGYGMTIQRKQRRQ